MLNSAHTRLEGTICTRDVDRSRRSTNRGHHRRGDERSGQTRRQGANRACIGHGTCETLNIPGLDNESLHTIATEYWDEKSRFVSVEIRAAIHNEATGTTDAYAN
jgi:hypothetical protein